MATLKDIAKELGVSMMTVSRALNSPEQVSADLRERIVEASNRLNYVPHHGARSMASNKTGIIQIITGLDTTDYYFLTLIAGIIEYLSEKQYAIMISHNYRTNFKCDGIIVMSLHTDESKNFLKEVKVPCVLFGKAKGVDCIDVNNEQGMQLSVQHLVEKGHKKIGYIGIESKEDFAEERLSGYKKGIKEAGEEYDKRYIVSCDNTLEGGRKAARELLERVNVSAIACATDLIAMSTMEVVREKGKRIPEDISIMGFDGVYLNKITVPTMTTIVQPVYEIGRQLAEVMLRRISDPKENYSQTIIDTYLELGDSTNFKKGNN